MQAPFKHTRNGVVGIVSQQWGYAFFGVRLRLGLHTFYFYMLHTQKMT